MEEQITNASAEEICGFFEGYTMQRFIIITAFSLVSAFGVAANTLLMAVFWKTLPSSVYLATLATMDMAICLTYVLLFGVDAGFVYMKNTTLFFLYHRYIIQAFFVAKVVQFAIPFLLILITLERFMWTTGEKTRVLFAPVFNDRGRCITVTILMIISFILRVPVLFATTVKQFPDCPDYFRSESVSPTEWASSSEAYYVFDFHVITAVQTCFPFIILLTLNLIIVQRLIQEKRDQLCSSLKPRLSNNFALQSNNSHSALPENYVLLEVAAEVIKESLIQRQPESSPSSLRERLVRMFSGESRGKRSQIRNAIYTMLAIVMSYLVCNGVHLFLTFLERTDASVLYDSDDHNQSSNFYIALSDTVSICYMVSSAVRILIYCKCNPKLRKEIRDYLTDTKKQPAIESSE